MADWSQFTSAAFGYVVDRQRCEALSAWHRPREFWYVIDCETVVGSFRTRPMRLTVAPSQQVDVQVVSSIGVSMFHRRRGVLTYVMGQVDDRVQHEQCAGSVLMSDHGALFRRFGYTPMTKALTYKVSGSTEVHGMSNSVELREIHPNVDGRSKIAALFEQVAQKRVGELSRDDYYWRFDVFDDHLTGEPKPAQIVGAFSGAKLVGFVRFTFEGTRPWTVVIHELHSVLPEAELSIWRFLCGLDSVTTVVATRSIADLLVWHVLDSRSIAVSNLADRLWVRWGSYAYLPSRSGGRETDTLKGPGLSDSLSVEGAPENYMRWMPSPIPWTSTIV